MLKKIRKSKKLLPLVMCMVFLCAFMSVSVFATGEQPGVSDLITDLGTMVTGILAQGEAVFAFITSPAVLPWVLLGVAVSLISVAIWWAKWIMWGK